jgi:hypothetical protein
MAGRSWTRVAAACSVVLTLVSCTGDASEQASPTVAPSPAASASDAPTPSSEPTTVLASGEPLPEGCDARRPTAKQTVTFVADGRAWAMDPDGDRVVCLFEVDDAAPFAWGPQGDRVAIGGLAIHGFDRDAPELPSVDAEVGAFDWGHPLGLAVVYADGSAKTPEKRFMDDGHVERLPEMPRGTYLDVAYHPSGLALGVAIEQKGEQSIWLTTNEGEDPERLVFSEGGTLFPAIAFTPDGSSLVWIAKHLNTYQVHRMDLTDRTGFDDGWRGEIGEDATNLHVGPDGNLMALDVGTSCADRRATAVLSPTVARPALPDETRPTTILGWLDRTTVLVATGGCDELVDLSVVDVVDGSVAVLIERVEIGASRAPAPPAPDEVPEPPQAAPPPPDEGVG